MENDYSSFMEKNDDGSIKSFNESKLTSYIDSLVSKGVNAGVENYKNKQAEAEKLSKMSIDEQLALKQKEFDEKVSQWEQTMKQQKRELVVEKAKAKLGDNFSKEEKELYIKYLTDDEKESMKYIDSIVAERNKFLEEKTKSILESLQKKQPVSSSQSNTANEDSPKSSVKRTQQEIKEFYK